ncbi:MAG: Dabb family protein [Oscillospiraceae bacterium]
MVRHVIIWNYDEDKLPLKEQSAYSARIKEVLEGLKGKVPGLLEIKVVTEKLPSSNGDIMLDSLLESPAALEGYQVHPAHLEAAQVVRAVVKTRSCMDFEV